MARMPGGFIDLVVTSPPYDNLRKYNGYSFDFEAIAKELFRVVKVGGVVVWVVADATVNGSETGTSFRQALFFMECGFRLHDTMIYERPCAYPGNNRCSQDFEYMFVFSNDSPKTTNIIRDRKNFVTNRPSRKVSKMMPNGKRTDEKGDRMRLEYGERSNIWFYKTGGGISSTDDVAFDHPAIFPEQLAKDHILSWSNEGDLVYDCFGGSGTTAKMAHEFKRNWILSEISSEYAALAQKRIDPYLNQLKLF